MPLDRFTQVDDLLREIVKLNERMVRIQATNEKLLRHIAEKDVRLEAPQLTEIRLDENNLESVHDTSRFYYERRGGRYFKFDHAFNVGGAESVSANTYPGGANEPTTINFREYLDIEEPVLWTGVYAIGTDTTKIECGGGLYCWTGNTGYRNPFLGTYSESLYSGFGNVAPTIVSNGTPLRKSFDPPIFIDRNREMSIMWLEIGGADEEFNFHLSFIKLEEITQYIGDYGLE